MIKKNLIRYMLFNAIFLLILLPKSSYTMEKKEEGERNTYHYNVPLPDVSLIEGRKMSKYYKAAPIHDVSLEDHDPDFDSDDELQAYNGLPTAEYLKKLSQNVVSIQIQMFGITTYENTTRELTHKYHKYSKSNRQNIKNMKSQMDLIVQSLNHTNEEMKKLQDSVVAINLILEKLQPKKVRRGKRNVISPRKEAEEN